MSNKILTNNYWDFWNDLREEPTLSVNERWLKVDEPSILNIGRTPTPNLPPVPKYSVETNLAIKFSCFFSMAQWWLFRGMWFIPYLFRAFRLQSIWEIHNNYYL